MAPPCEAEVVLVAESFEGASTTISTEWDSGETTTAPGFSEFLGPLGAGREEVSKSFVMHQCQDGPAEEVVISFTLYQIDEWTPEDKFYVEINGNILDLGEMDATSISQPLAGTVSGIQWERETVQQGTNLGFGSASDFFK